MSGMKRWTVLLVTVAATMTIAGCRTTVVKEEPTRTIVVPAPDHHDDHRDDHRIPPPPDRR